MVAHPDVDLVAVVVRVPGHHDLVVRALEAGKAVFCEWPLGATRRRGRGDGDPGRGALAGTAVGLQARSDPTLMYARELVQQGYVGEVLAVRYSSVSQAVTERGPGRIWQGDRRNGANTLTIAGGHAIDALCFVLGELTEVSARLATRITEWHNTETGADDGGRLARLDQRVGPAGAGRRGVVPRHDRAVQPERDIGSRSTGAKARW